MNTDCKLIWESYELLTELAVSKANVQRLITKYGIDEPAARSLINRFNEVEGALAKKDIFTYNNIDELKAAIGAVTTKREQVTKGAIKVFENDKATVLLIRTKEASIKHGRKTEWCISYDDSGKDAQGDEEHDVTGNRFDSYSLSVGEPSIYFVISKTNDEKFAILKNKDGGYGEIRDKNNGTVELQYILSKYNLPESIFKYVHLTDQERFSLIKKDLIHGYLYARDVIKGRWPEAEPYIMKDPHIAYLYANDLMEGKRWPEAEPYIMKDPSIASNYATNVIKGRWPEAEPYIMKHPGNASHYATYVIKGRWSEAEPYIIENPYFAYVYARDVIKGRWSEAEPYIMKDPYFAYEYAKDVIEDRWPEAEPYIMKNPGVWPLYTGLFNDAYEW